MSTVNATRIIEWLKDEGHCAMASSVEHEIVGQVDPTSVSISQDLADVLEAYGCPLMPVILSVDDWEGVLHSVKLRVGDQHHVMKFLQEFPKKDGPLPVFFQKMVMESCNDLKFAGTGDVQQDDTSGSEPGSELGDSQQQPRSKGRAKGARGKKRPKPFLSAERPLKRKRMAPDDDSTVVHLHEDECWYVNSPTIRGEFTKKLHQMIQDKMEEDRSISDKDCLDLFMTKNYLSPFVRTESFRTVDLEWGGMRFSCSANRKARDPFAAKVRATLHKW
jgi:hypothetical protein